MLSQTMAKILEIEQQNLSLEASLSKLRTATLDEFGELLLGLPRNDLPHLSTILPNSTSNGVQEKWTGSSGVTLLRQSVSFLNFVSVNYQDATGRLLKHASILDFGCGWGRLLRLMPYFAEPAQLYGCDAWDTSLQHIADAKVQGTIARSDVRPSSLPFPNIKFNLIYAFSIFTHLPPDITATVLTAFRASISDDGLAIITVRPREYWHHSSKTQSQDTPALEYAHDTTGFAFHAHQGADYGDASMTREYIEQNFPAWKIVKMGATIGDFLQIFVCLKPV